MGKTKKNKWVKKRHRRVFAFLRFAMRGMMKARYHYTAQPADLPAGPYLILCNHQTTMDPFFLSLSFRFQIYFFASDDIFNLKVSPLIKYLVAPIPKSKSLTDLAAIKDVFRVLREKGAVGIFPEGNRTVSGGQWEMTEAIAKLAKAAKVPLVLYNLCGGYGTDPRWGHNIRKGRFHGYVRRILSPEEVKAMPLEELFAAICDGLKVDDTVSGVHFKSRRRAEYIERALYLCPQCGAVSSFRSEKNGFACGNCGLKAEYTEDLRISPAVGPQKFGRIFEWYEYERKEIVKRVLKGEKVGDAGVLFRESIKFKRKKKLAGVRVSIDKNALTVSDGKSVAVYPLGEIEALTMVGKKKFNFYHGGKILQIKGGKRFCAVKYVHIFDGLRSEAAARGEIDQH